MRVEASYEPGLVVAVVAGRFDVHGMDRYTEVVLDHVDAESPNVIVDLSGVEFMDSSALSGLVRTLKRTMSHNGVIVLAQISDAARIILELTRLEEVFAIAATVEDARRQVHQAA